MGENLVRNLVSHGETVTVWNRTYAKSEELAQALWSHVIATKSLEEFVDTLKNPSLWTLHSELWTSSKQVFLLVPAGRVTDEIAHELFSLLSPGDAIWDLGNAHWDTTIAHQAEALKYGIHWIGCGISGGSEGARLGPSLMPGGDEETIRWMLPILEKIAAKDFSGNPCVTYVGREAAGNFVKMVHNGIEYAIMQGIAEVYDMVRFSGIPQSQIQEIFRELNSGLLKSFLMDITVDILGAKESDGTNLLEKISDVAGSKGTGGWTVEAALKFGVPVPSIAESLFARWMSGRKHEFSLPHDENWVSYSENDMPNVYSLRAALLLVYFGSYLQGIDLILTAEKTFQWWIDISEVMRIWQGGCIIRSQMLEVLPKIVWNTWTHIELEERCIEEILLSMKHVNSSDQPSPVIDATYNYLQTFFVEKLPTNLIQAMRDSFGAHGVKRIGSDVSENFTWK